MSQAELARRMGVTRQAVHDFMWRETHRPVTIGKIAKALDVPVDHFFD